MNQNEDDDRLLEEVRRTAVRVLVGLVAVLLVLDRFGPTFFPGYVALGEAALGLILGTVTVLIVGQGIDIYRRNGSGK